MRILASVMGRLAGFVAGIALAFVVAPAAARDVGGYAVPEEARLEPGGLLLKLNGARVRSAFLSEVTLFALYTDEPVASYEALLRPGRTKRVNVTILRPEFTAQRFRDGWREQFAAALAPQLLQEFAPQIEEFIGTFETLRRGEEICFDFLPGQGLRFRIRGELKRNIAGDAFAAALLGVWLGERAVDPALREALLGEGKR